MQVMLYGVSLQEKRKVLLPGVKIIDEVYHESKIRDFAYGDNKVETDCSEKLIKMLVKGRCLKYVKR